MKFEGKELADRFHDFFGRPIETITPQQMRWLVCLSKHIRLRCRNNAALKNYLSSNFRHLRFAEETRTNGKGEQYKAMTINGKNVHGLDDTAVIGDNEESE